ncbi:MAG: hypothetical protein KGL53_13650, partial [Elusimicrobia bacterium]|nr:hypothetical protein [Elusimicrobiota bacterium]
RANARAPPHPRLVQAAAMERTAAGLISNLQKQIDKPGALKGVPPDQAAALKRMLAHFQAGMAAGQASPQMTPQQVKAMLDQVMWALRQNAPAAAPGKKRPALVTPPSGD